MPTSIQHQFDPRHIRCEKSIKTSEEKKGWIHILLMLRVPLVKTNWPASSTKDFQKASPRPHVCHNPGNPLDTARLMHSDLIRCENWSDRVEHAESGESVCWQGLNTLSIVWNAAWYDWISEKWEQKKNSRCRSCFELWKLRISVQLF